MAKVDLFTDEEFLEIVNQSKSIAEICAKCGYTRKTSSNYKMIKKRMAEVGITDYFAENSHRHHGRIQRSPENVFIENSTADQKTLRRWYIIGEYTPYQCAICGQPPVWRGEELTLILDHINGNNKDDRLNNLRWVCPNCNIQLPTTKHRNPRA